jgi:hypothetical protein
MPTPIYSDVLTKASEARLAQLVQGLPHPVALAGGHAVRLRVEEAWRAAFGQQYFGSRDIDLAYLVEPEWSKDEFRASAAGQAPKRIKQAGYEPMGSFRFGLILDKHGNVLKEQPRPPAIPGIDFDTLYLDPIVTHKRPDAKEILGFNPVDEPLLAPVFHDASLRTPLPQLGPNVFLPTAPILIATKLKSLPDRTKDDKAIKDLCDLHALATFGGATMDEIRQIVHQHLPDAAKLANAATRSEHLDEAATFLDVPRADIVARIAPIVIPPRKA